MVIDADKNCKWCCECKAWVPTSKFHKNRSMKDGLQAICIPCYDRRRGTKRKKVKAPPGHKHCYICQTTKPVSDFYWTRRGSRGGGTARCKECAKKGMSDYRKNKPQWSRDSDLKKRLGVAPGTYTKILDIQCGKCAVCSTTDPKGRGVFHLDHCHINGTIRGLLCNKCNAGLGFFCDDANLLEKAINYLRNTAFQSRIQEFARPATLDAASRKRRVSRRGSREFHEDYRGH